MANKLDLFFPALNGKTVNIYSHKPSYGKGYVIAVLGEVQGNMFIAGAFSAPRERVHLERMTQNTIEKAKIELLSQIRKLGWIE